MSDIPPPPAGQPSDQAAEPVVSAPAPTAPQPAEPIASAPPPTAGQPATFDESTVARSVYLYAILLLSVIGMVVGGIMVTKSLIHVIEPDTGHRDTLDRVAVGLAAVGHEGVDIARDYILADTPTLEDFCPPDMPKDCVDYYDEQYGSALDVADTVDRVVASFQDETRRQIRVSSIGWLIVGLVLSLISLVTFRAHAPKAALYRS